MKLDTLKFDGEWEYIQHHISNPEQAAVVFVFGDSETLQAGKTFLALKAMYPQAEIVGASSSGHILGTELSSAPVVATAVKFSKGSVAVATLHFQAGDDIQTLSKDLIGQLPQEKLKHVFVLSDGTNVNGSALVRGINDLGGAFSVSGGMAGDGDRFVKTWVVANAPATDFCITAVGFYGDDLEISTGCYAGWSPFGANRIITKSDANVLYELDGKPALELYKTYLGDFAKDLPLSGLRFPLNIRANENEPEVIRTLLSTDEKTQSITFAGDVPEGYMARLMKPNIDDLIDGAGLAAEDIRNINHNTALGLVVSCVGRRAVIQQMIEEELDVIEDVLGSNVFLTGFYSYGEIAPFKATPHRCELHNQTMTLTAIYERA